LLGYKACKVVMPLAVLRPKSYAPRYCDRVQPVTDGRNKNVRIKLAVHVISDSLRCCDGCSSKILGREQREGIGVWRGVGEMSQAERAGYSIC
jgi:hypothetical protein